MKIIKSNIIIFLFCYCGSTNKKVNNLQSVNKIDKNLKIGVVGCDIVNSNFPTQITKEEINVHIVQNIVNEISLKKNLIVLNRTKIKTMLNEYALSLSGLIQTKSEEFEVDILSTDLLLMCSMTGFSTQISELSGDEDMIEASHIFQGKVNYYLNFELIDSRTGNVQWTYSKGIENAEYRSEKKLINMKELFFKSLTNAVKVAVDSLNNAIK